MQNNDIDIASLREKAGLSIEELADRCGKSTRTIYRWESGHTCPEKLVVDMLKEMTVPYCAVEGFEGNNEFTFIDLFSGIGGLRMGFEAVGGKCVFSCEWNKYCRQTYKANFKCDHPFAEDIREVLLDSVPQYDLLIAGFPCQPFSIAGVSKKNSLNQPHGFACKTQGTLFFNVANFISCHRPKAFLLENVKGLVSHDKGNTFRVIINTLRNELGYNVDYRIINAKSYLPQNRERIYIAGFRDIDFSFDEMYVPDPESGPVLKTILHPEDGSEEEENPYTVGNKARVSEKYTLSQHLWQYLQDYSAKHKAKGNGFGCGLVTQNDKTRTLSARYYKDGSEILVRQEGKPPRRLTPRECSRLMGFDSPNGEKFIIPVSDTQAYRQFGNAVAVPAVEAVARYMFPLIMEAKDSELNKCIQLRMNIERNKVNV
ncbi:MAG: DNA (cytosine-5-)-methyltransferase [Peptococcaceae bacterium]